MNGGIRLARAILSAPIQLGGRATTQLPGEEKDLDLVMNVKGQMLEVHQGGKLVRLIPASGVSHMIPAETGYGCDVCGEAFESPQGLGPHMRHKHGVKGE